MAENRHGKVHRHCPKYILSMQRFLQYCSCIITLCWRYSVLLARQNPNASNMQQGFSLINRCLLNGSVHAIAPLSWHVKYDNARLIRKGKEIYVSIYTLQNACDRNSVSAPENLIVLIQVLSKGVATHSGNKRIKFWTIFDIYCYLSY